MKDLRTRIGTVLHAQRAGFLEVRVFGSALTEDRPEDLDCLIVYDDRRPPGEVAEEASRLADSLTDQLGGTMVHVTVLSRGEIEQLAFFDGLGELVFRSNAGPRDSLGCRNP